METEIGATDTDTETVTETTEMDTSPPAPAVRTIRIVVENATPRGGIARPTVERGERVVLVVRSDVADEVHLHGYDVSRAVVAGGSGSRSPPRSSRSRTPPCARSTRCWR